jgi:putative ABC transport system ATP-binding protein
MTLFELDRVRLTRGGKEVLRGITASIDIGASAVAGPSGCGKSSLLRVLNRLADPDSGSVSYRNRSLADYHVLELRREVSLVPQLPALLEGTVERNIAYAAELAGQVLEPETALDLVGLDRSFAGRDASRLSVGEQQRVMLARALAQRPSVLLLDEPTSALDEASRDSVEATLLELRRHLDISLVLVTHDLDQAERLADSVLRLDRGHVA